VDLDQFHRGRLVVQPVDVRRHPRFKMDIEIAISSHTTGRLVGRTVDISESGISAILKTEAPLGELVQLQFSLPLGEVEITALVRQRNAFRYGFEFVEQGPPRELVERTCRRLFVDHVILNESSLA
jgi:PilZ domain